VYSGGVVSNVSMGQGAQQIIVGGASAVSTIIGGIESQEAVQSGGVVIGTIVKNGGVINLAAGGTASDAVVSIGGLVNVNGALLSATILGGGSATVYEGGVASDTNAANGAGLAVTDGASAISTYVHSNAYLRISSGGTADMAVISNGGYVYVSGGGTLLNATVESGATGFVYSGGVANDTEITYGGFLVLSGGSIDSTTMDSGATIDAQTFGFASGGSAVLGDGDVLSVTENGVTSTFQLAGDYTGEYFHVSSDGLGGTDITVNGTPCYCAGTLILTDRGEVAVETLKIGDRLVTKSGEARALRWIGRRGYSGVFARNNPDILPVTIRQGALDGVLPRRDLQVSPMHAMYIDGMLIPANCLVNGVSIVHARHMDVVEYFHLELESHDVIFAEGAASESFVDDGSRGMFHNAAEYQALYPGSIQGDGTPCAPRVEFGAEVEAVWQRLAGRRAA
jgi:autotransporter passenger strand-loop-strand repeat protein